jgi:heme exporter protein D
MGARGLNMSHLFAMGGYGGYIWTAYGITFTVFLINLFVGFKEKHAVKKTIQTYLTQLNQHNE